MSEQTKNVFERKSWAAIAIATISLPCAVRALPNPISACQTITEDSFLSSDIVATSPGPCIIIGASNISLFLSGHTIDVRSLGMFGGAISVVEKSNVLIKGHGTVLTYYEYETAALGIPSAIVVAGSTNVEIHDVSVSNRELTSANCPGAPFGIGIEIIHSGANAHNNTVTCYEAGIDVFLSSPANGGNIGFNTVAHNKVGTGPGSDGVSITRFGSFGIGLRESSNWTVNHNSVQDNGFGINPVQLLSGGIILENSTSNNTVVGNTVTNNTFAGIGIAGTGSTGNVIVNDTSNQNLIDMLDLATPGANTWVNDRCITEAGTVPAGLCHP